MAGHRGDAGPLPPWKSLAGAAPAAEKGQTASVGTALPNAAARARFLCVWGRSRRAARSGLSQGDPVQEVSLQGTADSSRK